MENLYNFLFWHNPYEKIWYAIERDTVLNFFNGRREDSIHYKAKDVEVLIEILTKKELLKKLQSDE